MHLQHILAAGKELKIRLLSTWFEFAVDDLLAAFIERRILGGEFAFELVHLLRTTSLQCFPPSVIYSVLFSVDLRRVKL